VSLCFLQQSRRERDVRSEGAGRSERFFGESRAIPPIADNESEEKREMAKSVLAAAESFMNSRYGPDWADRSREGR